MAAIKGGEGAARRGDEEGGDKRQRLSKHQRRRVSAVRRAVSECSEVGGE